MSQLAAAAALFAWLVYWLWFKTTLFSRLAYTSDILRFTQAAVTWLRGLPLLYEYNRGAGSYLHNNLIVLLFSPAAFFMGSYGLIALTWIVYCAAALAWLHHLYSSARQVDFPAACRLLIITAFAFGPIAFWLWDDPVYGWHPELLYPPLALLLLDTLVRSSRWFWLWAALIMLVREDGAIVGWAVHSMYMLQTPAPGSSLPWRRLLRAAAAWGTVFFAGMALLFLFGEPGRARTVTAFRLGAAAWTDPVQYAALTTMLRQLLWMLSPLCALLLLKRGAWMLAIAAFTALPIFAVVLASALPYLPDSQVLLLHGATWGPRIALFWALGTAAAAALTEGAPAGGRPRLRTAAVVLLSIALQLHALQLCRGYDFAERVRGPLRRNYPAPQLGASQRALLRCVAEALPKTAVISGFGGLEAFFHRHIFVWPENTGLQTEPPSAVVCDVKERFPFEYGCMPYLQRLPHLSYQFISQKGLKVAIRNDLAEAVATCRSSTKPVRRDT